MSGRRKYELYFRESLSRAARLKIDQGGSNETHKQWLATWKMQRKIEITRSVKLKHDFRSAGVWLPPWFNSWRRIRRFRSWWKHPATVSKPAWWREALCWFSIDSVLLRILKPLAITRKEDAGNRRGIEYSVDPMERARIDGPAAAVCFPTYSHRRWTEGNKCWKEDLKIWIRKADDNCWTVLTTVATSNRKWISGWLTENF